MLNYQLFRYEHHGDSIGFLIHSRWNPCRARRHGAPPAPSASAAEFAAPAEPVTRGRPPSPPKRQPWEVPRSRSADAPGRGWCQEFPWGASDTRNLEHSIFQRWSGDEPGCLVFGWFLRGIIAMMLIYVDFSSCFVDGCLERWFPSMMVVCQSLDPNKWPYISGLAWQLEAHKW